MANSGGSVPVSLPVLDGKNYEKWSIQMKVVFGYQEVLDVVKNGVQELGEDATEGSI